ncbi:MAG: hypothetical protein WD733_22760 [Bryobacterales bacterium]
MLVNQLNHLFREAIPALGAARQSTHRTAPRAAVWLEREEAHIGLLILFGPEVRAFLQSGFAHKLAERYRVSVITVNPASAAFSDGRWQVHRAPEPSPSAVLQKLRGWQQGLHDAWMQRQGHARWRHELRDGVTSPRVDAGETAHADAKVTARFRNDHPRWLRAATLIERTWEPFAGSGKSWSRLFERLGLDCLVAADYAAPAAVDALRAASRKNLATVVVSNSWKDVYAHPYVAAPPTCIGVTGWPEASYLCGANPHLSTDRVAVVGSLHLERFLKPSGVPRRAEFCRQAGLDASRPFVCYTAAAPRAVTGEESIVETMLETIEHHRSRPQVLLRLNPREDGERFRPLQSRFANLVLQKPCWEWDPRKDWNAPLPQDLDTWVATVQHAAFNVSIPSTVTLEFSAAGRLTLNVCFDAKPLPPEASNARFWGAPFYQRIRTSSLVAGAFSERDFRELLACRLDEPGVWDLSPPRRYASPMDEAEKLVRCALAVRAKEARPVNTRRSIGD